MRQEISLFNGNSFNENDTKEGTSISSATKVKRIAFGWRTEARVGLEKVCFRRGYI